MAMASSNDENSFDEKPLLDSLELCHMYGIKQSPIYNTMDRRNTTYFLLPPVSPQMISIQPSITAGILKPIAEDFERFWNELPVEYKERRLLASYFAVENRIQEIYRLHPYGEKQLVSIMNGGHIFSTRLSTLDRSVEKFRSDVLPFFVDAYSNDTLFDTLATHTCYNSVIVFAGRGHRIENPAYIYNLLKLLAQRFYAITQKRMVDTYFCWASLDVSNLQRFIGCKNKSEEKNAVDSQQSNQKWFMKKLSKAAPRWSQSDRLALLRAIENNGNPCVQTYMNVHMEKVGVDKFKKLAFGKERFCAHCRRSSYIGEDRLSVCKRCVQEHARPRAWYCNKECQRGDWIKHKAVKHSIREKTSKKPE